MTTIVEQPMTKRDYRIFVGMGIAVLSAIVLGLVYFKLSATETIVSWIAVGIGITGFTVIVRNIEVKE